MFSSYVETVSCGFLRLLSYVLFGYCYAVGFGVCVVWMVFKVDLDLTGRFFSFSPWVALSGFVLVLALGFEDGFGHVIEGCFFFSSVDFPCEVPLGLFEFLDFVVFLAASQNIFDDVAQVEVEAEAFDYVDRFHSVRLVVAGVVYGFFIAVHAIIITPDLVKVYGEVSRKQYGRIVSRLCGFLGKPLGGCKSILCREVGSVLASSVK